MKEVEETTFNGGDNDEEEQMVVSCSSSTYFTPSESDEEMKKVEEKAWQVMVSVVRDPGLKEWRVKGENIEVPSSDRKGKRVEDMEHEGNIQENGEEVNQMEEAMLKEGDGTRQRGRTREGGDRRERKTVVSHVTFEWSGKVDKGEVDSILQQEVGLLKVSRKDVILFILFPRWQLSKSSGKALMSQTRRSRSRWGSVGILVRCRMVQSIIQKGRRRTRTKRSKSTLSRPSTCSWTTQRCDISVCCRPMFIMLCAII